MAEAFISVSIDSDEVGQAVQINGLCEAPPMFTPEEAESLAEDLLLGADAARQASQDGYHGPAATVKLVSLPVTSGSSLEPCLNDISALFISVDELPRELNEYFLSGVIHYMNVGAVFVEIGPSHCEEVLGWLARLTEAVTRLEPRLNHPILVAIPPDFTPDRELCDKIVRAGGMPFYAPMAYRAADDKDTRLGVLNDYLKKLRAAAYCAADDKDTRLGVLNDYLKKLRAAAIEKDLLQQINSEDE